MLPNTSVCVCVCVCVNASQRGPTWGRRVYSNGTKQKECESTGVSNVFLRLAVSCGIPTETWRVFSCGVSPERPNRFVLTSELLFVSFV